MTSRSDGRTADQLRPVRFTRGWLDEAEGSCLVEFGRTRVLCAASLTPGVPRWRRDSGQGWVTGEYAMLPRAATSRDTRESIKGRPGGRTQEISRLIGRSLRAVVDTSGLGENTLVVDCDVLQADGGTRTAAITGAYVAIHDAIDYGRELGWITGEVLRTSVCAVSVGIVAEQPRLDLHYDDDVAAATDMNVVMTGDGRFVEIQGTAEEEPYTEEELTALLALARSGCQQLTALQAEALAQPLPPRAVMLDGTPTRVGSPS
jgi:ribonuclease PH